jgi:hypothetical protein
MAALIARLYGLLFGCRHSRVGRPITLGGRTYQRCLECGAAVAWPRKGASWSA